MVGNYQNARIFVQNSPSGILTGVLDAQTEYISDKQLSTLDATAGIRLVRVTAWSTRILFVEVISPDDNTQPGISSR